MKLPRSLIGRIFYNFDLKFLNNFKLLMIRHYYSIEISFLLLYVLSQLFLIILIYLFREYTNFIVSVFIILFLFLISLERIILQFKSGQAQIEKDKVKKDYYELKLGNEQLREKNKNLIEDRDSIHKILLKSVRKSD